MLLDFDDLDTIGADERDWLKADLSPVARHTQRDKLKALAKRYSKVTPAADPTDDNGAPEDARAWGSLRGKLQAHFQWASKHGKLLWRKTAYALRGPRPHQTVGFGEDPRDRERPQRGAAGLNADFEDEGVENDPYEFDDDLNEE